MIVKKRQRNREVHGKASQRKVPTAAQYKEHQVAQGLVCPDAVGGLYQPSFLKSFMHPGWLPFDISQYFNHPRPWHGAPAATLRRAMHAFGGARLGKLNPSTRQQLWDLQKLYFFDDEDDPAEQSEASGQKRGPWPRNEGHGQIRGPEDSSEPWGIETTPHKEAAHWQSLPSCCVVIFSILPFRKYRPPENDQRTSFLLNTLCCP